MKDLQGDGRHVTIDVVSAVFEGKSAVDRQRMVYKAIWQELAVRPGWAPARGPFLQRGRGRRRCTLWML